jgi:citrate lyase beta subunit
LKTDETRQRAVDAITGFAWRAPTVAVRVNAVGSPWFEDDVAAVVGGAGRRADTVVLPKVESGGTVVEAVDALDRAMAGRQSDPAGGAVIGFEALIETALGLVRVEEIAAATARLEALIFGAGDYAASMGLPMAAIGAIDAAYPGDQWAYPRARIAVAARAFGLDAIDGPYGAFHDLEGLAESARRARALGFSGKWAIHPAQIETCLTAFSPTSDEVLAAERTLADLDGAVITGEGATVSDGSMIDEASRRQAERTVEDARRAAR